MGSPEDARRYSDAERRALCLPFGQHVSLTPIDRDELLAEVEYRRSLGEPASAMHFRRSIGDGSCMHLVISDDGAELHRDRFDPGGSPALLLSHLTTEAIGPAASLLAAITGVLRRMTG